MFIEAAIVSTGGTVELDPGLSLNPKSSATPLRVVKLVRRAIPVARVSAVTRNRKATLALHGRPRANGILAVSLPPVRSSINVPGLGDLWLDPGSMATTPWRSLDANGSLTVSTTIPNALPLGTSFAVQGLTNLKGIAALSTPVVATLR